MQERITLDNGYEISISLGVTGWAWRLLHHGVVVAGDIGYVDASSAELAARMRCIP